MIKQKKHCPNFVEEGCFSLRGKGLDKRQAQLYSLEASD
jgi:hypothetical protein